jgi:hypothetical protein
MKRCKVRLLKRICLLWLCVSFLFFQLPQPVFAEFYAKTDAQKGITIKKPQVLSSVEEDIPVVADAKSQEKGKGNILWILLGVALVGGLAAAAGGGGGGGGSSGGDDGNGGDTGDIVITGPAP